MDDRLERARSWRGVRTMTRAEVRTPILQALKATIAVSAAWALADTWLQLQQPFLAPWAALLTVSATVFRSVKGGGQIVLASFLGILLSFAAVAVLGYGGPALAVSVLIGLLISNVPGLRTEGATVATTALFVLTAGFAQNETILLHRFADTLLGVGVGLVVNMLIVPPLDHGLASRQLDDVTTRLGRLLKQMADDMSLPARQEHTEVWIEETRRIDRDLDRAEELLHFTRESHRWNARRHRSRRATDVKVSEERLIRLEDAIARTRSIARIIAEAVASAAEWDPRFREPWLAILRETGELAIQWDPDVGELRGRLTALVEDLDEAGLPGRSWPVYGALIQSLEVVVSVLDEVIGVGVLGPGTARAMQRSQRRRDGSDGSEGEG
ncbi:FUSC family protein [uncultured Nocardioides sp.]|uniref:FUSC family protein n=1 Tax=uncultured Nocardioides sp. TaxID=198441 RepID=UPI00261E1A37|nr:FUSC family protein [uncultured Nocardioides sp.]